MPDAESMSDARLMALHAEGLFTQDASHRIRYVNEPWANQSGRASAPRFFLGRTSGGTVRRFRFDLPSALVAQLETLCAEEPLGAALSRAPGHRDEYVRLLDAHRAVANVSGGPAYAVPGAAQPSRRLVRLRTANAGLLGPGFEAVEEEVAAAQPFFAIVEDGRAVSICRSVRITPRAHEAGVETLPAFRGRGLAAEVVSGWAAAVRASGAVPLYSTSWENAASQRVAGKIGARCFGVDFGVA